MKKLFFLIVVFSIVIIGCKENYPNDELLIDCLNDSSMDCYEKGKIFLEQDSLSEKVVRKLLKKSSDFDPLVIELILTSQRNLTDASLIDIIKCDKIDQKVIENIILSKTPVSKRVENCLQKELGIMIDHKYDNYQKIISICDGGVFYAENVNNVLACDMSGYILENSFTRPFFNICDCNNPNVEKMISDDDGYENGWNKGKLYVVSHDDFTYIRCTSPPYRKCAKWIKPKEEKAISEKDAFLIKSINEETNKFKLGNLLLNEEQLSEAVLDELNRNICKIDNFVLEVLMISQDSLSDRVLSSFILNTDIDDKILSNIMIAKSPSSNYIRNLLKTFRPEILQDEIDKYAESEMLISLCDQNIIVGDSINIIDKDGLKNFFVYNTSTIPLNSSISSEDKAIFINGGSNPRWVYGQMNFIRHEENITQYYCDKSDMTKKCMKLAKVKINK